MNPAFSGDLRQKTARGSQTFPARPSERGIVLVISLLLLSVITFMAVTFLVVSRSERGAVSTSTDQTVARLAADAAFERAQSELLAPIISSTNEQNYGLLVSTNFINAAGFKSGVSSYTNVNYNDTHGLPITGNDFLLNLANLFYNPRPPVFIANPATPTAAPDFRFYLDLNRNGRYDTNGLQPVINADGSSSVSNFFIGDPEWIGLLEKPGFPHSANNRFISRIAYIALPAGQALDINYIHNYAKNNDSGMKGGSDSFLRDEGVGTWEINLAAFLTDLNANQWQPVTAQYTYNWQNLGVANSGAAFDDALAFLRYRYAGAPSSLASVSSLFGANGNSAFQYDFIDGYSAGPVITNYWNLTQDPDFNRVGQPWPGADNTNHFWNLPSDLFDTNKISSAFTGRLLAAGARTNSYDRYTFYRLLAQLGTDSAHEANKINLNYDNLVQTNANGVASATNFYSWGPSNFFNVTALRLLTNAGFAVGIGSTNLVVPNANSPGGIGFQIQIYPTNFYTPSVHRLLQLAANIYDATTNRTYGAAGLVSGFPTVFQPLFSTNGINTTNIYIVGYQEVVAPTFLIQTIQHPNGTMHDLSNPNDRPAVWPSSDMFYGVPVVIGAKKGFPNFNQLAMRNDITGTRNLMFHRPDSASKVNRTNQMFSLTISNAFGLEAWNSYSNAYPRNLQMQGAVDVFMGMTNELNNTVVFTNFLLTGFGPTNITANAWSGYSTRSAASFIVPLFTNYFSLANSNYVHNPPPGSFVAGGSDANNTFPLPRLWLNLTTRVRFFLVDTSVNPNRIVDYVNLSLLEPPIDILGQLSLGGACGGVFDGYSSESTLLASLFCTNRWGNPPNPDSSPSIPTYGILYQIGVSKGEYTGPVIDQMWKSFLGSGYASTGNPANDKTAAIAKFNQRLLQPSAADLVDFGAPFVPSRVIHHYVSWQANDPLVHYTIPDLTDMLGGATNMQYDTDVSLSSLQYLHLPNNGNKNPSSRYRPWGPTPNNPGDTTPVATMYNLTVKDPLVTGSDSWNFPTNKFPNVGWLGRVHRGTPWQTVYLKSPTNDLNTWTKWTGNNLVVTNFGQIATNLPPLFGTTNLVPLYTNIAGVIVGVTADALFSQPVNDRGILDLFTAAFNDNATRGQMSINQTNLAGWSAVLGGVVVLTNTMPDVATTPQFAPVVISPAGVYAANALPGIVRIVNAINDVRRTNSIGQSFHRLGELLAVPELTTNSPFLNTSTTAQKQKLLTDDAYERLPQQILGLVKADPVPRFVIYSYGQALKPAANSLITDSSGTYFGLCTNYQITAEVATRAVVRIDGAPSNPHAVIENFNVLPPD